MLTFSSVSQYGMGPRIGVRGIRTLCRGVRRGRNPRWSRGQTPSFLPRIYSPQDFTNLFLHDMRCCQWNLNLRIQWGTSWNGEMQYSVLALCFSWSLQRFPIICTSSREQPSRWPSTAPQRCCTSLLPSPTFTFRRPIWQVDRLK